MSKLRLLVISLCAFVTAFTLREVSHLISWMRPLTLTVVLPNGHVSPVERALRPNYPYSVIPGGAYNPEELRYKVEKDPVVRAHYADFDVNNARVVTLTEDRYQYVSYRIKNRVYWTQRKLKIPKGETLLTDGKNFARTRCGNRLCASLAGVHTFTPAPLKALNLPPFVELLPRWQYAFEQPPAIEAPPPPGYFELPQYPSYVAPSGPIAENFPPPETISPSPVLPGVPTLPVIPSTVTPPPTTPPSPPVSPVPEPATISLFGLALLLCAWLIGRWKLLQRKQGQR